ncbi:MAG: ROK family protein [Clostridia bacterium]|nr:ROK family protein [Clostridia bacterium]
MLVMDIGGTFIKYACTDAEGRVQEHTTGQVPSDAQTYEAFCAVLAQVIGNTEDQSRRACVSIPGPFDFEHAVSLMQHKFPAIYQRSLRPPFEQAGMEVTFLHDSTAFMLGEKWDGKMRDYAAPCCIMLGTGLGFAFMRDARVCVNEKRTPAFTLWNMPWKDGIAEDYVSTRAIQGAYGRKVPIREIAESARAGDGKAADAFERTGAYLSSLLRHVLPRLGCDSLVLGGQIAKSADLFHLDTQVPWTVSAHLDDAALRGAGYFAVHGQACCEQVWKI